MMGNPLVCWHCGGSLADVPRPIRRSARCPHCRSDLHVCRLCAHYTTRYIGECSHDRAERVLDKTAANFCSYFRPRPDAHLPPSNPELDRANEALGALFGMEGGADEVTEHPPAGPDTGAAGRARKELESLFGIEKSEPADPQAADGDEPGDDEQAPGGERR